MRFGSYGVTMQDIRRSMGRRYIVRNILSSAHLVIINLKLTHVNLKLLHLLLLNYDPAVFIYLRLKIPYFILLLNICYLSSHLLL